MKYYENKNTILYCGNNKFELKQISDNSIDLILTDPPYGINKEGVTNDFNLNSYYDILFDCYRVLKNNSFFVTFASIGRLSDFFINNPFTYRWQYILYINNGMTRGSIGFNRYISILIFQKGNAKVKHPLLDIMEVSTSSKQCSERLHPTEKRMDVLMKLINGLSNENDIILDPFAGSGTTCLAANLLNRKSIGIEIEMKYVEIAKKRIDEDTKQIKFG